MASTMPIRNFTLPIPAFAEHTTRFVVGAITIGVEYRVLDEEAIFAYYGPDARGEVSRRRASRYGGNDQ